MVEKRPQQQVVAASGSTAAAGGLPLPRAAHAVDAPPIAKRLRSVLQQAQQLTHAHRTERERLCGRCSSCRSTSRHNAEASAERRGLHRRLDVADEEEEATYDDVTSVEKPLTTGRKPSFEALFKMGRQLLGQPKSPTDAAVKAAAPAAPSPTRAWLRKSFGRAAVPCRRHHLPSRATGR